MCGILGTTAVRSKEYISSLSSRMSHRGPDEREVVITKLGALSHERLAIVDLNTGRQPIQGTRNTWVIHNGEIYNHKQLHAEDLKGKYTCRTTSDSEVIVHLYEEYGTQFCDKLDGIFAFVVMDEDNGVVMAGRDPIGVKPLYYGYDKDGKIWFSSEMKVIIDEVVKVEIFPAGHYYHNEKGFVKYYHPKWDTLPAIQKDPTGLRELLTKAVEKRLMCDVPFGVLLSGGLDSSLIASIVARKLKAEGKEVHSFSIGLSPDAPDLKAARKVAEFLGTVHHEVYFSIEEGIAMADKLIWHLESYDVTTLRASTPMYFLTKYIREKGFKMVLSGEGADEVFGGYLYFYNALSLAEFQEETKRRVKLLYTADVLRADKSTMANAIEVRVPMLDKAFLEKSIQLSPELKFPRRAKGDDKGQIEKYVLRAAFDDKENPYLPDDILWRQKEQFSDGVGYGWIDGFKDYCEKAVSDSDFKKAEQLFPYNTPQTKEAFYIRSIFEKHFGKAESEKTVFPWIPKWQANADPSGRANTVHEQTIEVLKTEKV